MVWKEDWEPKGGDKTLYRIAPIVALVPALCLFAVIPFGRRSTRPPAAAVAARVACGGPVAHHPDAHHQPRRRAALRLRRRRRGVIGAALAGWSSNNKFALLGGLRAASQMVSYEVAMGLSLVGAFMVYQSVQPADMVAWQMSHCWGILVQPLAFVLFFTSAIAETKRVPFDVPEGESEVVAGYFTEYAGPSSACSPRASSSRCRARRRCSPSSSSAAGSSPSCRTPA